MIDISRFNLKLERAVVKSLMSRLREIDPSIVEGLSIDDAEFEEITLSELISIRQRIEHVLRTIGGVR